MARKKARSVAASPPTVPVDLAKVRLVAGAAALEDVRVIRFAGAVKPAILDVTEGQFGQRVSYRTHLADPTLPIVAHLEFKYEAMLEGVAVCDIEAEMIVVYRVPEPKTEIWPPDSMDQFARVNGPYTCWPYFRELTASFAARL